MLNSHWELYIVSLGGFAGKNRNYKDQGFMPAWLGVRVPGIWQIRCGWLWDCTKKEPTGDTTLSSAISLLLITVESVKHSNKFTVINIDIWFVFSPWFSAYSNMSDRQQSSMAELKVTEEDMDNLLGIPTITLQEGLRSAGELWQCFVLTIKCNVEMWPVTNLAPQMKNWLTNSKR